MRSVCLCLLLITRLVSSAQSTALDFTLDDCTGTSHHLFDELDGGKIIILEFAMVACSPCIDAGNVLQQVLADNELSQPGVVKWYALGYLDTYTCATMEEWDTDNGFTPSATFSNAPDQVDYYGGIGMPTIVVLAGNDHQVLLVQHGYIPSTQSHVEGAIAAALSIGMEEHLGNDLDVRYDPSTSSLWLAPTDNTCRFGRTLQMTLMDALGRMIFTRSVNIGETIPLGSLAAGAYAVKVFDPNTGAPSRLSRFVRE